MNCSISHSPAPRPTLSALFFSFLRLGLTAFGGPSMVAYIRALAVGRKRWLSDEEFRDGVALCQAIPGATAMQAAGYVGLRARGIAGALASFAGFGLPAFALMMTLAAFYGSARSLNAVVSAFGGLQAVVVAMVANAAVSFGKTSLKGWLNVAIALIAAAMFAMKVNPILVIVAAAVFGLAPNAKANASARPVESKGRKGPEGLKGPGRRSTQSFLVLCACVVAVYVVLFFAARPLFNLAVLMFRIDLFAFGGGFASVPLMFHAVVEARHWMDAPTFLDGIVLGQVTPGPIVITATFVGYYLQGLLGGLAATFGMFTPSFLILVGVVPYFDRLRASPVFSRALNGILCSFVGLLATVAARFAWNVHWDVAHVALAATAFVALLRGVDVLWVVLVGTVVSVLLF